MTMCLGPLASAVMNGRLISVSCDGGEFDLGPFGRFFQALKRHAIFPQIDALIFLEFIDQPIHHAEIEVVAAEVRVAIGGFDFEDAFTDFEHGDVEGAAAQGRTRRSARPFSCRARRRARPLSAH